jgi:hypothetical protein
MTMPPTTVIGELQRLSTLLLLLSSLGSTPVFAEDRYEWKVAAKAAGCELVTSSVAGKKFLAAKTTCTIDARLHDIGEVLRDIPNYPKWMSDCTTTTMLKVVDREKDVYVFWYRHHIPVFADRDMVLKSEVTHEKADGKDVYSIIAASTDEATYDAHRGFVRMPSFTSEWRLEEIDAEHTRVSFLIDPDLGEGIPASWTTSRITQTPFKSIQGLIRVLKERQLLGAKAP